MRKPTHDFNDMIVETFEHPETHQITTTRVPRRTKAETARMKRLAQTLDPERDFAVTRIIKGELMTLNVRATNGAQAARLADAIQADANK